MARHLRPGWNITIELVNGRLTHGHYVRQDEQFIVVKGTVGDSIGHEILVPLDKIMQIHVNEKPRNDAF